MTKAVALRKWANKFSCYDFYEPCPEGVDHGPEYEPVYAGPIDMVLHCPRCLEQHIDAPDKAPPYGPDYGARLAATWDNPPHRSHLCHSCGHIWRPCDIPTNGVKAILTQGKNDS